MSTVVIGIDPGLTGAMSLITREGLQACVDMPHMVRGTGAGSVKNQVNAAELAEILRSWTAGYDTKTEVLVMMELQNPLPAVRATPGQGRGFQIMQGSASIFSLGMTAGIIEGVVVALGLRHEMVPPAEWKKKLGLSAKGVDKKAVARTMAVRLFPQSNFFARVKDHNRAESALIGHYGYEKHA